MLERLAARTFQAIHRKDLAGWMRNWADDAVFEFPGKMPVSGRFVGKAAIEAWWRRFFERMDEIRFTPRRVAVANPLGFTIANTVFLELEVDLKTKDGLTAHAQVVSVLRLRWGKVIHLRDYFLDPTVQEAIWGRADEAHPA